VRSLVYWLSVEVEVKLLSCRWRVIHERAVVLGCGPRGLGLTIAGVLPYIVGSRSCGASCIRSVASGCARSSQMVRS
jgi:hypothetical protein